MCPSLGVMSLTKAGKNYVRDYMKHRRVPPASTGAAPVIHEVSGGQRKQAGRFLQSDLNLERYAYKSAEFVTIEQTSG